ncbi:ubiquitin-like protein 7 [Orussus abietinus]|uniref:ubiquitin-like protein 7 n=1 Tax=Orussus abietinus TaxID=222816 RepID=UPI0006260B9D|nr:ubiquitin-like protein 7 [Orussus abietinus]XP_023290198.1 ubiquitin-like protein 7 [Orussus abietinus]
MGTELFLGLRLTLQNFTTIKLKDVSLKSKVEQLRVQTAEKIKLQKDTFELIYCGCILEDDVTLEACGLKNGSMVHVLKKKVPEVPVPAKTASLRSILQLSSVFRSFNENPELRSALHRLIKRPEVVENIISSSPGLNEDPIAIAMLQDPELMAHFIVTSTIIKIGELHPALIEAAQHIAAAVHEEAHNNAVNGSNASTSNAQSTTAYSYSIDNLSDDEEMAGDSSQSSDSTQPSNLSTNQSNSAITTAQLATALSRAGARGFPLSTSSSSTSGASSNSAVITTEMFTQAMQQAFASTPVPVVPPPVAPILPPVLPQFADLQRQLAQMHEIGLQDDAVNVQALQFTNGDVQAAIDLVFSGFSDN